MRSLTRVERANMGLESQCLCVKTHRHSTQSCDCWWNARVVRWAHVRLIRRFVTLPEQERMLLLLAALVVAIVRLALWTLPFRSVRRRASRRSPVSREQRGFLGSFVRGLAPERLAWSIQTAACRIPGASCLTQALALQWLLSRAGYRANVHIGVGKDVERGFEAHAWLEHEGEILIGGAQAVRYEPIATLMR
jgi:hypothetical protein